MYLSSANCPKLTKLFGSVDVTCSIELPQMSTKPLKIIHADV